LIVIHKVLREGHPKALIDAFNRKSFFDAIRRQWVGYQSGTHYQASDKAFYLTYST